MNDRPAMIYVLCDSRELDPVLRIRYVGRTVNVERRIRTHRQTCLAGEHTARADWMRSVYDAGGDVLLEVVEVTTVAQCVSAEIAWITHYRSLGCRLMNLTDGGDGLLNPSPETRERIGAAKRGHKFWVGKTHTAETRAKISAAHKGHTMHPNTRAALYAPDVRKRQGATARARILTPAELERKRIVMRKIALDPVVQDKRLKTVSTPEYRARLSAQQSTPEAIARTRQMGCRNRGRKMSDAFRAACVERWLGRTHTETTKQKMSAWQRGGDSHRAKLTLAQVVTIRQRYHAGGVSQHQLARDYAVQPRTINLIVHNKTWVAA